MSRTRLLLIAVVALFIGLTIGNVFALRQAPNQRLAQERCEKDVLARLPSPESAKLAELTVVESQLDPETTDLSALSRDSFKGVDRSNITVRSVSGIVQVPNAFGDMLNDPFTCRAYFVDDKLVETLVVFEHAH
ncbi:hypothetical protein [Mycolicibacterium sp.]|uniref:hypothetical protein n=1 Tax=Mycolicibacterium sp. TaxID=2320850 RepID=UPI0028B20F8F|nr:hypothetical protein [Mycolicibacterium sp.]